MLFGDTSNLVVAPYVTKSIAYDPSKDFTPVSLVATSSTAIVVHSSVPVKTLEEFIVYAKANQQKLSYASAGTGTVTHLAGELFKQLVGAPEITHVPYRGAAPSLTDLLAGQIPMMFDSLPGVISHIESGELRALAVTTAKRVPQLPNVPTIAEAGLPGFEATAWFGLYGPKDIPADVVKKISTDVNRVLASEEVKKSLAAQGAVPGQMSQPEFATFVDAEIDKWGEVIKAANISLKN